MRALIPQDAVRRRFLQGLKKCIGGLFIHPIRGHDDANLIFTLRRLEINKIQQHA